MTSSYCSIIAARCSRGTSAARCPMPTDNPRSALACSIVCSTKTTRTLRNTSNVKRWIRRRHGVSKFRVSRCRYHAVERSYTTKPVARRTWFPLIGSPDMRHPLLLRGWGRRGSDISLLHIGVRDGFSDNLLRFRRSDLSSLSSLSLGITVHVFFWCQEYGRRLSFRVAQHRN